MLAVAGAVAPVERRRVVALPAVDNVGATITGEDLVVTVAAAQTVAAGSTSEAILACPTIEPVVACPTIDTVGGDEP